MTRQQEVLRLAEELLGDIELSRNSTPKHVLKAMRLARLLRDDEAQEWLAFEIGGVPNSETGRTWMTRTQRWTDRAANKGYWISAAAIESTRLASEAALATMTNASLSGDGIIIAQRERLQNVSAHMKIMSATGKVLAAIDAQIYEFATRVFDEMQFSELQASLFDQSRTTVDGLLAPMAGDVLKKIDSISERLSVGDAEAVSQAMSTCRRLIDAVADELFPAREEPYCIGQQALSVKQNAVLNRLNAFVHQRGVTGGRADRIRRSLSDLYSRVSSGVHSDVDEHEARYLFLTTYMILGEVLTLGSSGDSSAMADGS